MKACEFTSKHGHVIYGEVGIEEENTGIQEFWQSDQNSLRYRQNTGIDQNTAIVKMTDPYSCTVNAQYTYIYWYTLYITCSILYPIYAIL